VRGSSWREAEYLTRAADRYLVDPTFSDFNFGFRVVESTLAPLTSLDLTQVVTPGPEQATISLPPSSSTPIPAGSANHDWTPIIQDFDGVPFVYVPAGCFKMGSDNGESDETPVVEVCLEAFWIGQTEVTNKQFGSSWSWPGDVRPRETVNWLDARKFCEDHGGRLPTEAEWEYAARGPEGWDYPWGNDFVAEYVVFRDNSDDQTANVGRRFDGASWVGAFDMSGNVWEWTNSLALGYPYDASDGREDRINSSAMPRVVRGGGWESDPATLRSANRDADYETSSNNTIGFRCARSVGG
jgi:formylglycine-generating enzyme required for sulfatase activity